VAAAAPGGKPVTAGGFVAAGFVDHRVVDEVVGAAGGGPETAASG